MMIATNLLALILALFPQDPAPIPATDFPESLVSWEATAGNPVFKNDVPGRWDAKIRERGWILRDGSTYHLFYTGYNETLSPLRLLGHATSPDGIAWTRDPANPIHLDSWVEDICMVREGGITYLFAEGKNDRAHLMTSANNQTWNDHGPLDMRNTEGKPIAPGPYGTPTVFHEKGVWYLFYERGDRGVWLATSRDLKVWTNVQDEPILRMGPEAYDKYAVAFDQVIKRGKFYYAFYHANEHQPWKQDWTTCLARSEDLIHWVKYPGNPILRNNSSSAILVETPAGDRLYSMHPEVRIHQHPKKDAPASPQR